MMPMRSQLLVAPLLLCSAVLVAFMHQPGDHASAYSASGSTIFTAQVLTPTLQDVAAPPDPPRVPAPSNPVPIHPPHPAPRTSLLAPAQAWAVQGPPTITADQIEQVLQAYGSPLAGSGQALYNLGVKYGIDPAFCLAFFVHESDAGTRGEAVLTHNLGNIRATPGYPSLDGYRYYDTWLEGAEDWYKLIKNLYVQGWGLTTVDQIVPVYAPSADSNDPAAYVDDVEQLVSNWRAQASTSSLTP
jgi:hypothetical protein